jgi:uncharacterized protein (DUF1810 family)
LGVPESANLPDEAGRCGEYDSDVADQMVLPQLRSLLRGDDAERFGLGGLDDVRAYWNDPVLGQRLRASIEASLASGTTDPVVAMGEVNAKRFRSCLTMFLQVAPEDALLSRTLARFFRGKPCRKTLAHLKR